MESQSMQIAALGRPLYPGMLYDCRSDSFIPGITLWDRESLNKDLDKRVKPHTSFSITTSDSLSEKSKLLDVRGSLKVSILGGIVEIGGSAKYLNDKASSHRQSRVTMQYVHTVRFEQLTMTHLGKVTYPQVFEQKSATHVVTAVLYGAQAFFVFNSRNSSRSDKTKTEGELKMLVNKIPKLSAEAGVELNLTEREQELLSGIRCTFHGDFELRYNSTTFTEAVEVYRTLPELLGEQGEKAVPVQVWLFPLQYLDSKAAKLVREVSEILVSRFESFLEELEDVNLSCNDLMAEPVLQHFPDLHRKIRKFHNSLQTYRALFQKKLSHVLPSVRGGEKEEKDLESILVSHQCSPFAFSKLEKWLNVKISETKVLKLYTKHLDMPILSSQRLEELLCDPEIDTVICFNFTSLTYSEPYLSTLNAYLNSLPPDNEEDTQPSFSLLECSSTMRDNLKRFTSFAEANQHQERIKFVSTAILDPEHPGTSIRLYQRAQLVDRKYIPISKPEPAVLVAIQHYSATLRLFTTSEDARCYRVEYREKLKEAASGAVRMEDWTVMETPHLQETCIIRGLQPSTRYMFRYRAVSATGVSEASEVTEIQTTSVPLKKCDVKKYQIVLSLDNNTAHPRLKVHFDGSTYENEEHTYSFHPDRFTMVPQVLNSVCSV